MNYIKKLFLLFSTVLFGSMLQAATLNVPTTEYPTIQAAVTNAVDGDTIQVAAGTYKENVTVTNSLTLIGAGAATTIIDGNSAGSVLSVIGNIDVAVSGLTLQNGSAVYGGGVYIEQAELTVSKCVLKDNVATFGGAIANATLNESVYLVDCTLLANSSTLQGGAIDLNTGTLRMENCTVSGNTSRNGGGFYLTGATIAFTHLTITLNRASGFSGSRGGGIYVASATGSFEKNILAGNSATFAGSENVYGTLPSGLNNITSGAPGLAPLANNGGPTPTHALQAGSPALNAAGSSLFTTDQRGFVRPQGAGADIGAYECQAPVIAQGATVTQTMSEDGAPTAWATPTISATDLDSTTLTWSKKSDPTHGTATVSGTGASPTVTYVPTANWNGEDSFEVQVTDEVGNSNVVAVAVTVSAINDAPVNAAAPVVTGTYQVGQTLTATSGTWNDTLDTAVSGTTAAFTYAYQWQRGAAVDGPWENIGANAATYTLTTADNQEFVRVEVTATDNGVGTPATASAAKASAAAIVARIYNSTQNTYSDTIQAAITAASASDVITVSAGSYAEALTIDKKLTLQASGASYTVDGDITFKAADIDVSGCTLAAGHKWIVEAPAKIQDAIVAANASDTVEVKSGTYVESLTVSKALNLTAQAGAIVSSAGTAVTVSANGVAVRGFRLNGVIGLFASALGGLTVENNIIAAGAVGLQLQGLNTAAGAVTVRNNSVVLAAQLAGANPTAAIVVAGAIGPQAVLLQNNTVAGAFTGYVLYAVNTTPATTVQGGTITGVMQGVSVLNVNPATGTDYAPSSFVVDGVEAWNFAGDYPASPDRNFRAGVYVFSGGDVPAAKLVGVITNVLVSDTGKIQQDCAGLYFSDWSTLAGVRQDIKVTGCRVSYNANRGVIVRGANAAVEISTSTLASNGADPYGIGGNEGFGVSVFNGAQVNLHNSTIRNPSSVANGYSVTALHQFALPGGTAPSLTVRNCVIENNNCPSGLLAAASDGTMDALNNWWGSSVQAVVAAKITGNVLYTPWQSSAACNNLVPYGLTLSANSLNENLPVGTDVGTLGSTDTDGNPPVYTLADGGGLSGADNASFTIDGTSLKSAAEFDFETKSSYAICVQVSDGKGGLNWAAYTITVTGVNDAPTISEMLPPRKEQQDFEPVTIPLVSVFADAESDVLEYTVVVTGDPVLTASITGSDLTLTSVAGARGTATVTVTATEKNTTEHLFVTTAFNVTVKPVFNSTQVLYYDTILDAVAEAMNNDVIDVAAGTYVGALTLSRPLTITGHSALVDGDVTFDAQPVAVGGLTLTPSHAWYVTDNGMIQNAVTAANAGDTVNVAAGTYAEGVTVLRAVTIAGAGQGLSVINPPANVTGFILDGASNVEIYGFTVEGDGTGSISTLGSNQRGLRIYNYASFVPPGTTSANINVHHCSFVNLRIGALLRGNVTNLKLHHTLFDSIKAYFIIGVGYTDNGSGTLVGGYLMEDLEFTDNEIKNCIGLPINISNYSYAKTPPSVIRRVTISRNKLHDNSVPDLAITDEQGAISSRHGISDFTITDNEIWNNSDMSGISIVGPDSVASYYDHLVIEGNKIGVHTGYDRWVNSGGAYNTTSPSRGIKLGVSNKLKKPLTYSIRNNSIAVTDPFAVTANIGLSWTGWSDSSEKLDASGNWWGSNVPADVLSQVSANVDFTPWFDAGDANVPEAGFQGDISKLHVGAGSPQFGTVGRIQEGHELVSGVGSTVYVHAGTYNENQVLVTKAVSLIGDAAATTFIDGDSAAGLPSVGLVRITSTRDVTFRNFTVREAGDSGANHVRAGIYASSPSLFSTYTVSDCAIIGSGNDADQADYGFMTQDGQESLVFTNNQISACGANSVFVERHPGAIDVSDNAIDVGVGKADAIFVRTYGDLDVTSLQKIHGNTINVGSGATFDASHACGAVNFASASDGTAGRFAQIQITDNTVQGLNAYRRGITLWNNMPAGSGAGGDNAGAIISGNQITGTVAANNFGIQLLGQHSGVVVSGNSVSTAANGIVQAEYNGHAAIATVIGPNNGVTGCGNGVALTAGTASVKNNPASFTGNAVGILVSGAATKALIENNDLTANTVAGIQVQGGAVVDAGDITAGNVTGLGSSAGGNNLSGYGFDNLAPWAVDNQNGSAQPMVLAYANDFGPASAASDIELTLYDDTDSESSSQVKFSQTGGLTAQAPTNVSVQNPEDIPAGATTLDGFRAQGGVFSASPATVTFSDTAHPANDGTVTRTYTLKDAAGNEIACEQTITVDDTIAPVLVSKPLTLTFTGTVLTINPVDVYNAGASSDNGGVINLVSVTPNSFDYINIGANTVTLTVDDGNGNTSTAQAVVTVQNGMASPSATYADDSYVGLPAGTRVNFPNGGDGTHFIGYDAFATIQAAVDAVATDGTVNVAAGTYTERVVVNKANVTVQGAGVDCIVTGTTAAPGSGVTPSVFKVAANGVTVKGFKILVDFSYNHSGVHSSGTCTGLTVSDNTVIASLTGTSAFGYGLKNAIAVNAAVSVTGYTQNNVGYAGVSVTGNTIEGTGSVLFRSGIQMDLCAGTISGNTITSINHDFLSRFANQGDITLSDNHFLGGGAQVGSFNPGAGTVTITNNVFDSAVMQPATGALGTGAALRLIYFAEVATVNNAVVVSGNTFQNHRWAVSVEDFKNVTFDSNTFTPKADSTDFVHMTFNTKIIAGTSAAPTLNMFAVGATLTKNTFNGSGSAGGTALAFYNHRSTDAVFGTYTIGTLANENVFNAGVGTFIQLDGSTGPSSAWTLFGGYGSIPVTTMAPWALSLDLTNNKFDAGTGLKLANAMPLADLLTVEDKITHKVDNATLGFVRVKAANVYVTTSSGSIQRGIDAATAGDTVNVSSGAFAENLTLNKRITLDGQGDSNNAAVDTIISAALANTPVIRVTSSGSSETDRLVVKDLRVTGATVSGNNGSGILMAVTGAYYTFDHVSSVGNGGNGMAVNLATGTITDLVLTGCNFSDNTGIGFRLASADSIDGMTISGSHFDRNAFGFYNERGGTASFFKGLHVSDSTFDGNIFTAANSGRGFQVEKLTDATFERVSFSGNQSHGAIFNLKDGNYANISFTDCLFNNNVGANTVGLYMMGRNDAPSYNTKPASLTNVDITGCVATGNSTGISFGNNITDMTVVKSFLAGNTTAGLVNLTDSGAVSGDNNWWGSSTGPANAGNPGGTGSTVVGVSDFSPWLGYGTDTDELAMGFQPDLSTLLYAPVGVAFSQPPVGNVGLGVAFSQQPVLQVTNETGNVATQFTGNVTLAFAANPNGGVLAGTLVKAAVAGVATFTDLNVIVGGGLGFSLAATSPALLGSESALFDVLNPTPVLSSISPIFKTVNSGDFTLTLNGSDFVPNSKVMWGATEKTPATFSASQLTVLISNADIATAGQVAVMVVSPLPVGGSSAAMTFTVTATAQAPVVYVDDNWDGFANCGGHVWGYDAFATIQGALTGVAQDGTVNVLDGTYTETVTTTKRVRIIGAQAVDGSPLPTVVGSIYIDNNDSMTDSTVVENLNFIVDTANTLTFYGANQVNVRNCTFDGAGKFLSGGKNGISLSPGSSNGNSDVVVENCVFRNGLYLAIDGYVLRMTVRNCLISAVKSGLNIQGGGDLVVEDTNIGVAVQGATSSTYGLRFASSTASSAQNLTIRDCNVAVVPNGYAIDPAQHRAIWIRAGAIGSLVATDTSVDGLVINESAVSLNASGNWWGGADAAVVTAKILAGGPVDYTPWLGFGTDNDGGARGFQGDFSTLWVDDNSPQVGAVTRIQEGVNLVSTSGTVNVLAGTYAEHVAVNKKLHLLGADKATTIIDGSGSGIVMMVTANDCTISGFTVRKSGSTAADGGIGLVGVSGCVVRDNIATQNAVGIGLLSANNNVVADNAVSANGYGIALDKAGTNPGSTGNNIVSNTVTGNALVGFYAGESSGNTLSANTLTGNAKGVYLWHANSFNVTRNIMSQNAGHGVELMGCANSTLEYNAVTNNGSTGMIWRETAQPITGNVVRYNDLSGNTGVGLGCDTNTAVILAENNWWGSLKGPTHAANAGGDGAAVTDNVDFSPWLGDGTDTLADIGFQPNAEPIYYTPKYLVFSAVPADGALGDPLSPQPVVKVMNENDEIALQFTGMVYLALGVNPGSGTLSGVTNVNCTAGVATFGGLSVTVGGGSDLTLVASTTSPILGETSAAFDIANPMPTAGSLSPYWTRAGTLNVPLTVSGTGFTPTSVIRWMTLAGEVTLPTTFVSATEVTTVIPNELVATVGTAEVRVHTPAAGGGTSTPPLVFRIEAATPAVVYVDDTYGNLPDDTVVSWPVVMPTVTGRIIGYDAFATVQGGVDNVDVDGTVHVAAGLYSESIDVGTSGLKLLGPNAVISPVTGSRAEEAFISAADFYGVYVEAPKVTVAGFTFNGLLEVSDYGVYAYTSQGFGELTLANNIIENFADYGFIGWVQTGPSSSRNMIFQNKFDHIGGRSIVPLWNYYANVIDNCVTNTSIGIYAENANQAEATGSVVWSGNTISATRAGIWHNLAYGTATGLTIQSNTITVAESTGTRFSGLWLTSIGGSVNPTIRGNSVSVPVGGVTPVVVGYDVWHDTTTTGITVEGGVVSGSDYGVWLNNYDSYPTSTGSNGGSTVLKLRNVNISSAVLAGVYVKDNALNTIGSTVRAEFSDGCAINNSAIGVWVDGADASVQLGDTVFTGIAGDYVKLTNGCSSDSDATAATFDGKLGSAMSLAELMAVEDKITHEVDDATLGFVRVKDDNVYVTQASASIQRGIGAASAGDTVHVQAGTYTTTNQVAIDKNLTLSGAGEGVTTVLTATDTANTGYDPANAWVYVAPGVSADVSGFTFDGTGRSVRQAIQSRGDLTLSSCTIQNISSHKYLGWGVCLLSGTNLVEDCTFANIGRIGVHVRGSVITPAPYAQVIGCTYTGKGAGDWLDYGVEFGGGGRGLVRSCVITGCTGVATTDGSTSAAVMATDYFGGGTQAAVENCVLTGNTTGIVVGYANGDATAVTALRNDLSGNTAGIAAVTGSAVSATDNWFGSATGPANATNPGGDGTSVTGPIDFSPWLAYGTDTDLAAIGFQPELGTLHYLPVSLAFSVQPVGDVLLGQPFLTQPKVTVSNEVGGVAIQYNGTVSVTLAANPGLGILGGTTNVPVVAGVASFADLFLSVGGGTGFTLAASSASPILGATSAAFDIANPAPTAGSLSPYWAKAGSGDFVLTVSGGNFVPNSVVRWNGEDLQTGWVSATVVTAAVPARLVASIAPVSVTVFNEEPPANGQSSAPLAFRIEAATPSVVYVDDNYFNLPTNTLVDWPHTGAGTHIIGYDAFATVQGGVTAVTTGGTVNVAAGTYAEEIVVNKAATLLGPNALINPNAGARVDEALLVPPTILNAASSPREVNWDEVLEIAADNVVVRGFKISGDNPLLAGYDYAGMNVEAGIGIYSEGNNTVLQNNIIEKFTVMGIWAGGTQSTQYQGLTVNGNLIRNIHDLNQLGYGFGMYVQGTAGAIQSNVIANTRNGVQIQPYQVVGAVQPSFSGNVVTAWKTGIYYNYTEVGASAWAISGNSVTACAAPGATTGPVAWDGIKAETMRATGNGGSISGNTVDGAAALADPCHDGWGGFAHAVWGLHYAGASSTSTKVYFENNTVANVAIGFGHDAPADIVLAGNSLSATDAAIRLHRSYNSAGVAQAYGGTNNVDATGGNVINGVDTTAATLTQLLAIEDAIVHKVDEATWGLVRVRASNLYVTTSSGSIQRGIDAAVAGDTVNVSAGTFVEQVEVAKDITVDGQGAITVVKSPATLALSYTTSAANKPVVHVHDTANAVIKDITVDGAGLGNANYRFMGVSYYRAGGMLSNVVVTAVRDTPFSGAQHGNAIYAYADVAPARTLDVIDCQVSDFQKNGITMNGAFLTAHVTGNRVTGAGATGVTAQNGIQFGFGSVGTIVNNEVTGCAYTGSAWGAAGVLVYQSGVTITGNKVNNCQDGINVTGPLASMGAITNNDLSGNEWGLSTDSTTALVANNNWWGNANGPANATNPGGQGSVVDGNIDFSPWLAYGTDTNLTAIGFQPDLGTLHYLPVSLAFSQQPVGANLGALLTTQPWVTVSNEVGGVATQFNGKVAVRIGTNLGVPVPGVLSGTTNVTVVAGVAMFTDLAVTQGSGSGFTLVAESTNLTSGTSAMFNIENNGPSLAAIPAQFVNEQELLVPVVPVVTDADSQWQTLTFTLDAASLTAGLNIDPLSGVITWAPTESQGSASPYTVTVTVTDNGLPVKSASQIFTITVAEVNVAPVLPVISDQTVNEQGTLSFTVPTASDQDLPAQTLTYTLDAASLAAGMTINGSTGAFSWSPSESQGGTNYNVTVTVTDNGLNLPSLTAAQTFKITVTEINVAPVLDEILPQSVNFGQTLTFTATATDQDREPTQTLTFSLTGAPAGAEIDPATGVFTWTPTEAQAMENYSFTVTVTDNGSPALSASRTVTIGAVSASQSCPGFRSPSTSMVVSNSLAFGDQLANLTWTPVLPDNWAVTSVNTLGNGVAAVDGHGAIVYSVMPTASPALFTYTVSVPGDAAVSNSVSAVVAFNGLTASVSPIAIYRYHSADYQRDTSGAFVGQFRKIDSTEVNRVLTYWRANGYRPSTVGLDGFEAMSNNVPGSVGRHSADYNKDWKVDTDEASLVQEYWRAGGYHVDATSIYDGYNSDRAGTGPNPFMPLSLGLMSFALQTPPMATVSMPETYNPGKSITVPMTFVNNTTEKLLRFIWRLSIPEGWRVTSISGDGSPELDSTGTNVLLLAGVLPTSQITLTVTFSVPLNETRACSVGCVASYKFSGMSQLESLAATATSNAGGSIPLDANKDGLADAWATAYGITDAEGDADGDRMSNLAEYLCGTIPQDGTSYLRMVDVKPMAGIGVEVSWSSEAGRTYILLRAQGKPEGFTEFKRDLQAGPSGRSSTVDESVSTEPCFYRVKLQQ